MIAIEGVRKQFGRLTALDGVTLSIGAGERVGLVGANGSGKTTLLRALCGLLRVDGRIAIGGIDPTKAPERALAQVAYMPQLAPPIETTVGELVRAHTALRGIRRESVSACAARLGVTLQDLARTRLRDLSGGTKQKVLAALALAANARILVADEPTASLDAAARAAFFEQVDARPGDSVLVLCSHRVEEIRHLVDRVIELRDGRVHADLRLDQAGLRMCRLRVTVSTVDGELEGFLRGSGFAAEGRRRYAVRLSHRERLEVLALLLARHRAAITDLALEDVEAIELGAPARHPVLQVVR